MGDVSFMFWLHPVAVVAACALASGCTIARSDVKTLRDRGATHIRMDTLIHTSITALNDLPAKCGPTWDRRVREEEFNVYQVIGTIRGVKRAPDHDIHIILADPQNPDAHVIVELPDPDARGSLKSPHRDSFVLAMQMFEDLVAEKGSAAPQRSSRSPCPGDWCRVFRFESFPGRPIAELH